MTGVLLSVLLAVTLTRAASGTSTDFGAAPSVNTRAESVTSAEEKPSPSQTEPDDAPMSKIPAPTFMHIPRLGLSAPIDPVGVAPDGQVVVPEDPDRVGWYRFSPPPGSSAGSSVIVGHVDATGRGLGVLAALSKVEKGDGVAVERPGGTAVTYRIVSRRTVAKDALGESEAFRRDGPHLLTLITCAAPYVRERGGYQNNLVVTAVAVPR
ncbi:class F sortase [Streptomyces sp. NPDC097619]|uniref:class F sortase n=1 Tax=Streptomyces sp. NPDC097619 TaxID=3157228 RepID=UPI0033313211